MTAVVAGLLMAWLTVSIGGAIVLGRAIRIADDHARTRQRRLHTVP